MNEENRREMDGGEIDLLALMYALLKKWWLLLIGVVVGGVVAFVVTWQLITPTYQSSATLYMVSSTVTISSMADLQLGSALAEDFGKIVTSKTVVDRATERLKRENGKSFTRGQIMGMLSVSNTATRMLTLTTVAEDPEDACDVANAVAEEFQRLRRQIRRLLWRKRKYQQRRLDRIQRRIPFLAVLLDLYLLQDVLY